MVLAAILNSPVAVREIIDLGDKLRKHKIRVKDIIRDADDDNAEFDEEEADRRILRLIDKVKHLDKVAQDLQGVARDVRRVAQEGHRGRDRGQPAEDGRDARGDAPQQEDHRQGRRQAARASSRRSSAPRAASIDLAKRARPSRPTCSARRRASRAATRRPSASTSASTASTPDDVLGAHSAAQKNLKKVEEELQLDVKELRETYEAIREGERIADKREGRARRGEPPPRRQHREEVHEPRPAVPRPDPGGQHRPDEGRRQVRVQARLQVLHLRDVVDPAGHHARHRRSGPHHPHPGAHDRDDQQADPHQPLPRAGVRPRADARGDRREDGAAARQGPQGPQDRQGAHQPRDPHRRGGRLAPRRLHRGQERRVARPRRSST